jgi:DNA-binding transcriptional regulator GbsR (MarR family)|tara:strand:- start:7628 stop:8101 length:474 start_codon:yes stop_codon:yes gene_type:complete
MTHSLTPDESEFIETMGVVSEGDGLPRIAGRMWGLLVVTGGTLSSAEIAELLEVSRGSVSTNLRFLEQLGIVRRMAKPGDRQTYFTIRDNPYSTLMRGLNQRVIANANMVRRTMTKISDPEARDRLQDLATFYEVLDRSYTAALKDFDAYNERAAKG